jgi:FkbM family methyltransferase
MKRTLYRSLFRALAAAGKPWGGLPPRRLYHFLARRGFGPGDLEWHQDRWGNSLRLSPYYWIDRHVIAFGTYDEALSRAIDERVPRGAVCMDVGANIGVVSLQLATRVGDGGRVHAFEPVASVRTRLEENVARNRPRLGDVVGIEPFALSDHAGDAVFHYASADRENQGMGSLVSTVNEVANLTQTVSLMTLDSFVHGHAVTRLDMIKVDVQGGETAFLEGARETLRRFRPELLMEISPEDLQQAGSSSPALCRLLSDLGYRLFELDRGRTGREIDIAQVSTRFAASNVLCAPRVT